MYFKPSYQRKLDTNLVIMSNGECLQVKHLIFLALASPISWTIGYTVASILLITT